MSLPVASLQRNLGRAGLGAKEETWHRTWLDRDGVSPVLERSRIGRLAEEQYTFSLETVTRDEVRRRRGEPWKVRRKGWLHTIGAQSWAFPKPWANTCLAPSCHSVSASYYHPAWRGGRESYSYLVVQMKNRN